MTPTAEQVLAEINAKPRETRARPKELERHKNPKCTHEWKRYRQSIRKDERCTLTSNPYFIVLACSKCKEKHYIDMKMGV